MVDLNSTPPPRSEEFQFSGDTLIAKIKESRKFNQGFATVEYLAASRLDLDWHTIPSGRTEDAAAFEAA